MDSSTAKEPLRERTIGTGTASGGWKGGPGSMRMGGTGGMSATTTMPEHSGAGLGGLGGVRGPSHLWAINQ